MLDSPRTADDRAGRRRPGKLLLAAAAAGAIAVGLGIYYVASDVEIDQLEVGWAGKEDVACVYDDAAEQMTARLRVEAANRGPVEVHLTAGVWHEDPNHDEDSDDYDSYERTVDVVVEGNDQRTVPITFDLPENVYDAGFTQCYVSADWGRAEPWD